MAHVNVNGGLHGQNIRICPKADYLPPTDRCDERFVPEFFPGMDVREVYLNRRNSGRRDGVSQGYARMSVGRRIQRNHIEFPLRLLNPANQLSFEVGLPKLSLGP